MKKLIIAVLLFGNIYSYGQSFEIEALWRQYQVNNYDAVIEGAAPVLETEPVDMNLLLGRAYTDKGEYKKAVPHLSYAIENDDVNSWRKEWALGYLGTCQFVLQNYDEARESLEECINMNFTRDATRYALKQLHLFGLDDYFKSWTTVETENFKFHFQKMSAGNIKKYVAKQEEAFKNINNFFNAELPKKIDFFVWSSEADAKEMLFVNMDFANSAFCIVHSYYKQTTGCEMARIIAEYSVPVTLERDFISWGAAVHFDQTSQDKVKIVKDWLKSKNVKLDISDVWFNWQFYPTGAGYPIAGLFVGELIDTFGKDKFLEFFKNQSYENAKAVFGKGLDDAIANFENKINM